MATGVKRGRAANDDAPCDPEGQALRNSAPGEDMEEMLGSEMKGILQALQKIKQQSRASSQKKNMETISRVSEEVKQLIEDGRTKSEKERQGLVRSLTRTCSQFETQLKEESSKIETAYKKFKAEHAARLTAYEEIYNNFVEIKEKLAARLEQQRKKDKQTLADLQRQCLEKISTAEVHLTKVKKEAKSISILKKSLGSILGGASDDDEE